ncbi:MAG: sugar ABC transporter permease [Chloroflexi bacterium]|nr:sugar ABC transporter permease [Chloroflexota bacterium]
MGLDGAEVPLSPTTLQGRPLWRRLHLPDRYSLFGMAIILPALVFFLVFRVIPLAYALWVSFHEWNLIRPMQWVGLQNYWRAFSDEAFLESLWHSFLYAAVVVAFALSLALLVAVLLDQKLRFAAVYRGIFFMPVVMSWVVISIVWRVMYAPTFGLVSNVLGWFGLPDVPILTNGALALFGIMIMGTWHALGFYMVVFLAGLQTIPVHLYEAALIDGAGKLQTFTKITLPLLRPTMLFAMVMCTIDTLQVFVQVYLMTRGGPADSTMVAVYYIYRTAFYLQEMGYGAALGMILLLLVLGVTLLYLRFVKVEAYY